MRTNVIALAVAIVVLLGAGIAGAVTHEDDSEVTTAASGVTSTVPTTVPATMPTPSPPPTTAAPAPAPTTPTTAAAATTTTVPPTTTTAVDCGKGSAKATSNVNAAPQEGGYLLTVKVDVTNDVTKAIGIDRLVVKVTYGDGTADLVEVPTAKGAELQPKETKTFSVDRPSPKAPTASSIDALDFHISGQPTCPPKHLSS